MAEEELEEVEEALGNDFDIGFAIKDQVMRRPGAAPRAVVIGPPRPLTGLPPARPPCRSSRAPWNGSRGRSRLWSPRTTTTSSGRASTSHEVHH
jgi:hypothetical protein